MVERNAVEIELYVEQVTDAAMLVGEHEEVNEDALVWIPLSQVMLSDEDCDEPVPGQVGNFVILRWILEEKGLV
jgi:hypothetical protein